MTAAEAKELESRRSDLERAMRAIGRIVVDATVTPKQRLSQVAGILRMHDCEAPTVTPSLPLGAAQ
jgi:hypothetical protein